MENRRIKMDYEAQKLFEKFISNPRGRALMDRAYGDRNVIIPEREQEEIET
jgi:hypothetical protein